MEKRTMLSKPLVAALLAGLCNLLWGSAIPFINLGYRLFDIPGGATATQILFAGCRFFLAGALTILFASVPKKRLVRPAKQHWGMVVKLGLVQTVAQYVFFYIGVANTASVKASLIQGLGAFVSILVASYIFRSERMNGLKWLGGLIGVAGVAAVHLDGSAIDGSVRLIGEGALLISMCASACSAGLIKRYGQREDPVAMSGWQFMFGGVVMALGGLAGGGRFATVSAAAIGVLLYLALLSAVAYTIWALLLRVNPVSRVAVYMFLQPIFGVLLGLLMLGGMAQAPLMRYAVALALVCVSIVLVGRGQQKSKVEQPPQEVK